MTDFGQSNAVERDEWLRSFVPSNITFIEVKTGRQIQEPSLAAVKRLPNSGASRIAGCFLAVGSAALAYQNNPDVAVFSPLRHGQLADYTVAQHMFRLFYHQLRSGLRLFKPIMCVHEQEHTTEVEERALIDAMLQMGARRVVLYRDSLAAMRERAQNDPKLRRAYILHIEPQEGRGTV